MDTPPTTSATPEVAWYNKPGPALAVGIALLALCALCAFLWLSTPFFIARPLGYISGAAGMLLVYGGIHGLREGR